MMPSRLTSVNVAARLREDPASVNKRLDQWDIPQGTPLHWAAALNREDAAKLLLEKGADPNILAGNGLTALNIADAQGAAGVAALLEPFDSRARPFAQGTLSEGANTRNEREQHGGKRATAAAKTSAHPKLEPFEQITNAIVEAYRFARKRGFERWMDFAQSVTRPDDRAKAWALPLYRIDERRNSIQVRQGLSDTEWDAIVAVMAEKNIAGLDASGQMTDGALERIAQLDHVTRLSLGGSKQLTDDGLKHLARMPRLQELDLSEYPGGRITDRGLEVLRHLPELRKFHMCWQRGISDAGVANLAFCDRLESVDLLGTQTGDGVITALAGKRKLRRLKTGRQVTDAALPLLHQFPVFKTWQGGDVSYALMSADAEPNHLLLDGPFTNKGLAGLSGLNGLFALSFFWHISALTADGLEPLADLPNLGFLGCEGYSATTTPCVTSVRCPGCAC